MPLLELKYAPSVFLFALSASSIWVEDALSLFYHHFHSEIWMYVNSVNPFVCCYDFKAVFVNFSTLS